MNREIEERRKGKGRWSNKNEEKKRLRIEEEEKVEEMKDFDDREQINKILEDYWKKNLETEEAAREGHPHHLNVNKFSTIETLQLIDKHINLIDHCPKLQVLPDLKNKLQHLSVKFILSPFFN
jgi:hypothetical protein